MPTFQAYFRSAPILTFAKIEAAASDEAVACARAFYEEHQDMLHHVEDDPGALAHLEVRDDRNGNLVAAWMGEGRRSEVAAKELLDAATFALRELREFYNDDESEAVRVLAMAVSNATGRG
jgi:hypothetical protein